MASDFLYAVFFVNAALLIISSIGAVYSSRVMRGAIWLLLAMISTAVTFLTANSDLLFGLQISVYGGGISILILFAVTLIEQEYYIRDRNFLLISTLIIGLFAANVIFYILTGLPDEIVGNIGNRGADVGDGFALLKEHSFFIWDSLRHILPFLAMLMLGSLIASVKLVLRREEDEPEVALV